MFTLNYDSTFRNAIHTFPFFLSQFTLRKFYIKCDYKCTNNIIIFIVRHAFVLFSNAGAWPCYLISYNVYLQNILDNTNFMHCFLYFKLKLWLFEVKTAPCLLCGPYSGFVLQEDFKCN